MISLIFSEKIANVWGNSNATNLAKKKLHPKLSKKLRRNVGRLEVQKLQILNLRMRSNFSLPMSLSETIKKI